MAMTAAGHVQFTPWGFRRRTNPVGRGHLATRTLFRYEGALTLAWADGRFQERTLSGDDAMRTGAARFFIHVDFRWAAGRAAGCGCGDGRRRHTRVEWLKEESWFLWGRSSRRSA